MHHGVPAIRRLQLGHVLRELRKRAGLSIEQAGPDLDMSASSLNRYENGQGRLHPMQVRGVLELYGATDDEVEEIMAIAREAHRKSWWVEQGMAPDCYAALESEAERVRNFELVTVPGILQTEQYATALFELDSPKERHRNLVARMNRAKRLTGTRPVRVHAVIDEGALLRPIGGREAFRTQLRHLVELAASPNVTVQVLPLGGRVHLGIRGGFSVLTFPRNTIGDLAYVDHAAGELLITKADRVAAMHSQFTGLTKLALDEAESIDVISRHATAAPHGPVALRTVARPVRAAR